MSATDKKSTDVFFPDELTTEAPPPEGNEAPPPVPAGAGELPPLSAESKPLGPGDKLPVEQWAKKHETADWLFASARVGKNWPRGQELTETEYLAGINWAASVTAR